MLKQSKKEYNNKNGELKMKFIVNEQPTENRADDNNSPVVGS